MARPVAREFVGGRLDRDRLFAGTPGLMGFRSVSSFAATSARCGSPRCLHIPDIKAASLHGSVRRDVLIELPEDDPNFGKGDVVGRLRRSLYGARGAPQRRRVEIGTTMRRLGSVESATMPSMFRHEARGLMVCLHVGDFTRTWLGFETNYNDLISKNLTFWGLGVILRNLGASLNEICGGRVRGLRWVRIPATRWG